MSPAFPDKIHENDGIDFGELFARIKRGLPQIIGFSLLGFVIAALGHFFIGPLVNITTTTRVVFAFAGYENGEYPDKSKFQADDLRSPDVIDKALRRQGLDTSESFQSTVRAALLIEGLIPQNVAKERDRLRAAGQPLKPYIPDEYAVSLSLPRKFPLGSQQRERLLNEIVSAYREKFQRTYANLPLTFGNAFVAIEGADYFEYELILNEENLNIETYLAQMSDSDRTFRSPSTNLSFADLHKQSRLFGQIRLNETLGLIRQNGLSKDRPTALVKIDYYLRTLEDQEAKAVEEEKVIQTLLNGTKERAQSYVLGVKSQVSQPRNENPILDQGLIDSLLVNDAYNFLVRQALEAGLKVKRIQSDKAVLVERRQNLQSFQQRTDAEQAALIKRLDKSLESLKFAYATLVENIRKTHRDYSDQKFNDTVRISMQASTTSYYRTLALAGVTGLIVGLAAGIGLSLVGIYCGKRL